MLSPNCYDFSLAGIRLRIKSDHPLSVPERFSAFQSTFQEPDVLAAIELVDELPPLPARIVHEDQSYRVHLGQNGLILRSFHNEQQVYAVSFRDEDTRIHRVLHIRTDGRYLRDLPSCLFHLGFEALMLGRKLLCLHASCIRTDFGGLLFSGPSGVGKSTQADLWCKYRKARLINGDRPILSHSSGTWLAWGSPYAGSSRCHINENAPISAVIMLRQAPTCSLRRLPPSQAFRAVWQQLTLHPWDAAQVRNASDLAFQLVSGVPIFEFSCTPGPEAVIALEQGLTKEGVI